MVTVSRSKDFLNALNGATELKNPEDRGGL